MDAIEAEEFQDYAYYGIELAEEAEDWVVRDNMLRLVQACLAAAQDVQNATDDVSFEPRCEITARLKRDMPIAAG
jgi:hypothetical protein